jgi:hypothetical protein
MFLMISRSPRKRDRSRGKRKTASLKAKNRRRVNRMAGRRLSKRGCPSNG